MKKETMRRYSLLGLVLIGASAVTAAVLPKKGPKKAQLAKLQASVGANGVQQLTCSLTEASVADNCNYTATAGNPGTGSRTTAAGNVTSSITTTFGAKVKTITDVAGRNSSKSPA